MTRESDRIRRPPSGGASTALDWVVEQLQLVVQDLKSGAQLRSEGDLAVQYGVSRLTVREALKVLAGRGLVELGRGRRPIVREPDSSVLSGYLAIAMRSDVRAIFESHTIRTALEVLSASEAARSASRAGLRAIETALDEMDAAIRPEDPHGWADDYNAADVSFHEALALASGNRMLAFILEGMRDALARSFSLSFEGFVQQRGDVGETVARHRRVFERVVAGDPSGAGGSMADLLQSAGTDLRHGIGCRHGSLGDDHERR